MQLCIVHLVRHSLNFVSWKQRKEMVTDLKDIYAATTEEQAEASLTMFSEKWDAASRGGTTGNDHPVFCLLA